MTPRLPSPPPPFPPEFRALLQRILARAARLTGIKVEVARARTRALSQSGSFVGHRPYVSGDDPRRLDWNAYARTGGLFVKLLEEDELRATTILLDCSASMLAGRPMRWTGALRLAAILGGLALQRHGALRIATAGSFASFTAMSQLEGMLQCLAGLGFGPSPPLATAQRLLRQGPVGRLHWLSDFADPASFDPALAALRRSGVKVLGWLPEVDDDTAVPDRGWLRLVDPESGEELAIAVDPALAHGLQHQLALLRRRQDRTFAGSGCLLQRFPVPADGDFSWQSWVGAAWRYRR